MLLLAFALSYLAMLALSMAMSRHHKALFTVAASPARQRLLRSLAGRPGPGPGPGSLLVGRRRGDRCGAVAVPADAGRPVAGRPAGLACALGIATGRGTAAGRRPGHAALGLARRAQQAWRGAEGLTETIAEVAGAGEAAGQGDLAERKGAVLQRRLRRARELLLYSAIPLGEIALACGFASASHFSNRFRQAFGAAPGLLRAARQS